MLAHSGPAKMLPFERWLPDRCVALEGCNAPQVARRLLASILRLN